MQRETPFVPTCPDAEVAVIGCLLVEGTVFEKVAGVVSRTDFFSLWCSQVFEVATDLHKQGTAVDLVTMRESLRERGLLDDEMEAELRRAELSVPSAASVMDYTGIVRDTSNQRRILEIGVRLQELAVSNGDGADAAALLTEGLERVSHNPHTPMYGCDTHTPIQLIPVREYMALDIPDIEWLWEGVIPRGTLVMMAGDAKIGKSTSLRHLVRALCTASLGGLGGGDTRTEFLGRELRSFRIAWFSVEEAPPLFRAKLAELEIQDGPLLLQHPGSRPLSLADLPLITRLVREHELEAIVIDPFGDFVCLEDENDAAEAGAALRPLRALTRATGCTVIVVHHTNKGRDGLNSVRGSTAIAAGVDIVLLFDAPEGEDSPVRRIRVKGRYGKHEILATLIDGDYRPVDPVEAAHAREAAKQERDQQRAHKKEGKRRERIELAKELIISTPGGATREAAKQSGIPANDATGVLHTAIEELGGTFEPARGNQKAKWLGPPKPTTPDNPRHEGHVPPTAGLAT